MLFYVYVLSVNFNIMSASAQTSKLVQLLLFTQTNWFV